MYVCKSERPFEQIYMLSWNEMLATFFIVLKITKVLHTRCSEPLAEQAKCDHVITCGIGIESGATLALWYF